MLCAACEDIARIERGEDPCAIARVRTGYVRLLPCQYYAGATIFLAKRCVAELHELPREERDAYLAEMADVAAAVFDAFQPRKLNYELLGNGCPHLHWWLVPRHEDDRHPRGPIWENLDFLRSLWTADAQAAPDERDRRRTQLLGALRARGVFVETAYA